MIFRKSIGFLKNIMGLWLIQESRRQWKREGTELAFSEIIVQAEEAEPFLCFVDPEHASFEKPGDVPQRVREYCMKTGQNIPENRGGIARCIYESIAMKYRMALEQLEQLTGRNYNVLHIIGGGSQDHLLCQMTADCTGKTVQAGPVEATAIGNICTQLMALNVFTSIEEARNIVSASVDTKIYKPLNHPAWEEQYQRFCRLVTD